MPESFSLLESDRDMKLGEEYKLIYSLDAALEGSIGLPRRPKLAIALPATRDAQYQVLLFVRA